MLRRTVILLVLLLVPLSSRLARAVDRHDQIRVKSANVNGRPGFRLKLAVRPESYTRVRIGLGRMSAQGLTGDKRALAAGDQPGYLRLLLGEHSDLVRNQPRELEFTVTYGDKNDLKPGDKVDVVSAWGGNGYWHVYGMFDGPVNQNDATSVITLP